MNFRTGSSTSFFLSSDVFRKKVEQRLFTTEVMLWGEVKKRAATNPQWQWHRRDALDALKESMVHMEVWREDAGYIDRSPPPPKTTLVQIQERSRDDDSGLVELRVTPVHGDTVYAEIGGDATTASLKVENGLFSTDELRVSFLAVDSTGVHPNGPTAPWQNRVTMKYRFFVRESGERMLELRAAGDWFILYFCHFHFDSSQDEICEGELRCNWANVLPAIAAWQRRTGGIQVASRSRKRLQVRSARSRRFDWDNDW